MATADPGSGPVSFFGVSNKLQSKVNSFREVIERKKLEVRRVSKEMRSLIEKKEEAIIRELDSIWEELNAKMEKKKAETHKKIEVIELHKKEMERVFETLDPDLKPKIEISNSIDSVKRKMDIDIPNVKVTWRVDELEDCINRMCRCDQKILVYNKETRYQLKWSNCKFGSGDNQLHGLFGVATNPMNENIYVTESHKVQIFSKEGERIRSFKDCDMINPKNIIFLNQSIYVQCYEAILKLNGSTEKIEKSKSFDFNLRSMCSDNIHIYVGQWKGMTLIVLTLDLIEDGRISLQTGFCQQDTEIRDISLSQELFYILLSNTEFPIQAFSREGILIRCVVKNDSINDAYSFFLDQQYNIFVADNGDSKVKIFSNEGKLLTQFGEEGSEKGQFQDLLAISVDDFESISTVDRNENHILQIFSYF